MARFVAFYSYKGGVGRSLALANTAWALMERGCRVVMLDMDLEAPGLHALSGLQAQIPKRRGPGVVEYAAHYANRGQCPKVSKYLRHCDTGDSFGKLWLMPAGRGDDAYQQHLAELDWRRLHPQQGNEAFVAGLKEAIIKQCRPDYVLIDARTGFSDVGGFSTHMLADMVVLVFNLTLACIDGTARAYGAMTQAVEHFILVASPIPQADSQTVDARIERATTLLERGQRYDQQVVRVQYDPNLAMDSPLAVRHPKRFAAARQSYLEICRYLQLANVDDVLRTQERAEALCAEGKPDEALQLLSKFTDKRPHDANALRITGNLALQTGRGADAVTAFSQLEELAPDWQQGELKLAEAWLAANQPDLVTARYSDRGEDLGAAEARVLTQAYEQLGDLSKAAAAQRTQLSAVVREFDLPALETSSLPLSALVERREEVIHTLRRTAPYPEFDAEAFWGSVLGSLSLTPHEKRQIIAAACAGKLRSEQLTELLRIFSEETG